MAARLAGFVAYLSLRADGMEDVRTIQKYKFPSAELIVT